MFKFLLKFLTRGLFAYQIKRLEWTDEDNTMRAETIMGRAYVIDTNNMELGGTRWYYKEGSKFKYFKEDTIVACQVAIEKHWKETITPALDEIK